MLRNTYAFSGENSYVKMYLSSIFSTLTKYTPDVKRECYLERLHLH